MVPLDVLKLLGLFGDAQPHSFFETAVLGRVLLKKSDRAIEKVFKRYLLDNGWVRRCHNSWDPRLDNYQLTPKGDECFRAKKIEQLKRGKYKEEDLRHYRLFNRAISGKYGAMGMGEGITEAAARLRETHPHLYK